MNETRWLLCLIGVFALVLASHARQVVQQQRQHSDDRPIIEVLSRPSHHRSSSHHQHHHHSSSRGVLSASTDSNDNDHDVIDGDHNDIGGDNDADADVPVGTGGGAHPAHPAHPDNIIGIPRWLINHPPAFHNHHLNGRPLEDITNNATAMVSYQSTIQDQLDQHTDRGVDGEVVDALEHFFWGLQGGIAMELGALDGTPNTHSMTYEYEKSMGWRRILIDANPTYRPLLPFNSPAAFSAHAAICTQQTTVHYIVAKYVGGILEFMALSFLKQWHGKLYRAMTPPGNMSSLNFDLYPEVKAVECVPLAQVLHKAHVDHVNYFILDVEGGELEVLKSINWHHVTFDVLCIETDEVNRPSGYTATISSFLALKGYVNATAQQGRNTWFTHKDFIPSTKPG